jgi:hypothetical protein
MCSWEEDVSKIVHVGLSLANRHPCYVHLSIYQQHRMTEITAFRREIAEIDFSALATML